MKYNCRRTLVLAMTCFLCIAGASSRDASAADGGNARLIVYRTPSTGKFVIVQIYDGDAMLGSVSYGGTYQGSLAPGRHVLSVLATPRPKWRERPPTTIDGRSGQTYKFTAVGNGQGNLILVPAG